MAAAVAQVLGLDAGAVNVKATTEEGLGLTGDGRAMAAHAVCVVAPAGPAAGGAGRSTG
jgi:2C-methyl-D-erythritol 2,4-cyclodiphosphate synthase